MKHNKSIARETKLVRYAGLTLNAFRKKERKKTFELHDTKGFNSLYNFVSGQEKKIENWGLDTETTTCYDVNMSKFSCNKSF